MSNAVAVPAMLVSTVKVVTTTLPLRQMAAPDRLLGFARDPSTIASRRSLTRFLDRTLEP
jgi:hypothetical protein